MHLIGYFTSDIFSLEMLRKGTCSYYIQYSAWTKSWYYMADRYVTKSAYEFSFCILLAPAYVIISVPLANQDLNGAATMIFRFTSGSLTTKFGRIGDSMHI